MITKVAQERKNLSEQYHHFISENRWVPWIVVISVLISYGICLSGTRIGIDTEANLNGADEFLGSWYSIGRFSLVFIKNLLGMRELNPMTANILMMIMMALYGIFSDFMFYVFSGNDRRMKSFYIVFPALFLTHPCFTQQYIFTVQSFEVALGMLFCFGAVFCVSKWAFEGNRIFLIPGIFLMVWSFGSYQAFLPFYMAAALAVYLVYYFFHDNKGKHFYMKAAVCHTAAFLVGYVIYMLIVKAVLLWQKGFGFQGEYLEEQVRWATASWEICIGGIKYYMREVLLGENIFYTKTFFLFAVLFALHLLYTWVRGKRKEYVLYAAAALALVLSPFYLAFYQGGGILMRSQLVLPLVAAFFGAMAATFIGSHKKSAAGMAMAICLLFAVNQATTASRAIFSAQMTYENDKMTAQQLIVRMQELDSASAGQRVAMIGQYHPTLPKAAGIREETIGYSFFEWDYMTAVGVSKRGTGFLKSLGFPFEPATEEEYAAAKMYSLNMPTWPSVGSVQKLGDIVVVKFSN
ncbi:MAG: glucosyltransferase domain-containing protein [Clostridium sp.]